MEQDEPPANAGLMIRLDQFLKFRGITATGGQAKYRIQSGEVTVNGQVETRRGHRLQVGDVVEVDGQEWRVEAGMFGGGGHPRSAE